MRERFGTKKVSRETRRALRITKWRFHRPARFFFETTAGFITRADYLAAMGAEEDMPGGFVYVPPGFTVHPSDVGPASHSRPELLSDGYEADR